MIYQVLSSSGCTTLRRTLEHSHTMSALSGLRGLVRARMPHVASATYSTAATTQAAKPARKYGGLKDEDRIFQNLYGLHDWHLKGAMKRVRACY